MQKKSTKKKQETQANLNLYDEFLATSSIDRLQKILARFELMKMSSEIPGDIVECGVFKGSGLYTFAKIHQILSPNNPKKVIGFDFFESDRKMKFAKKLDKTMLNKHKRNWTAQKTILDNLAQVGIDNVELVAGNVLLTTKKYPKENLGFRISFLYLDVDNYEGTLAILKNLFPYVSPGGVVAFDEYALKGYGESDAVDEYFKSKKIKLKMLPWANTPSAYLIKESA